MGYKVYSLGEICNDFSYGYTASASTDQVGPKFLRITDIREDFINWKTVPYCKINDKSYEKNKLEYGDIVIARTGATTGINAVIDKEGAGAVFASYLIRYKVDETIANPFYIGYLMKTYEWDGFVNGIIGGSAQPGANARQFAKFTFKLPPLEIQNKVVSILNILEEKMKLNLQMISNLENLAQTLFKHWFVDFEFPNENGEPYRSSGGKMVESELGMIPVEFKVKFLSENVKFLSGGTPKTKVNEYWNGDIPFFTPKDITGSVYATQTEKAITKLGLSNCNSRLYSKNTIFITARGTVGKLNMANVEMAMNQSCFALQHKDYKQYFLYFLMQTLLREIIQGSNGAVFNAINLKDLNILKAVYPTKELLDEFEKVVKPIFESLSEKEEKNINLASLRDTLLPKLLSGEIELPTENEVKEHVSIP